MEGLDILINNAAINPGDATIPGPDGQQLLDEARLEVFRVNVVAPVRVAQAFTALLARGTAPRVVNISSGAGSLTRATEPDDYCYGASKAALNMVSRTFAWNVRDQGITVIMVDPGAAVPLAQALHHADDHRTHVLSILGTQGLAVPRLDVWAYARSAGLQRS